MVSDAKKKQAALKKAGRVGSSKSLASSADGGDDASGVDGLATRLAAAAVGTGEETNDRSVTCVLTSHPQVRGRRGEAAVRPIRAQTAAPPKSLPPRAACPRFQPRTVS